MKKTNKILLTIVVSALVITGLQMVFATVPNPGHLLSELECNALFCINSTAGTVTIGGTASIPLIVNGRITSTGTPTANTDVATKGYVDGLVGSGGGGIVNTVEFTSSAQWTVPTGVEFINVMLIGGGGGGGSGSSTDAGAGGGSGYIGNYQLTVTPGEILNVVVGGAGGPASSGGTSSLTKADGKLLFWSSGGGPGGDAGDIWGGSPGFSGRCAGGAGQDYCTGCPSCNGQCGGGACGMLDANSGGYGGTGYGAGGGGGGSGEYGNRAGGGGGGYYGAVGTPVSASNGSGQTGGAGAPGIVIIAY